jgi:hypothetical protein
MSRSLHTLSLCIALVASTAALSAAQEASSRATDAQGRRPLPALDRAVLHAVPAPPPAAQSVPSPAEANRRLTWRDNPSLMDASWRQWPPLTDF